VAAKRFWTFSFFLPSSHRNVGKLERGRESPAAAFLSEFTKEGANDAWNDIGGDFDSRAGGSVTAMVA
jgi:hypothetical protein